MSIFGPPTSPPPFYPIDTSKSPAQNAVTTSNGRTHGSTAARGPYTKYIHPAPTGIRAIAPRTRVSTTSKTQTCFNTPDTTSLICEAVYDGGLSEFDAIINNGREVVNVEHHIAQQTLKSLRLVNRTCCTAAKVPLFRDLCIKRPETLIPLSTDPHAHLRKQLRLEISERRIGEGAIEFLLARMRSLPPSFMNDPAADVNFLQDIERFYALRRLELFTPPSVAREIMSNISLKIDDLHLYKLCQDGTWRAFRPQSASREPGLVSFCLKLKTLRITLQPNRFDRPERDAHRCQGSEHQEHNDILQGVADLASNVKHVELSHWYACELKLPGFRFLRTLHLKVIATGAESLVGVLQGCKFLNGVRLNEIVLISGRWASVIANIGETLHRLDWLELQKLTYESQVRVRSGKKKIWRNPDAWHGPFQTFDNEDKTAWYALTTMFVKCEESGRLPELTLRSG